MAVYGAWLYFKDNGKPRKDFEQKGYVTDIHFYFIILFIFLRQELL